MTTKTNFNIVCNSTLTSSFTGNIYNATYYVNLSSIIDDEIKDYNKKYKITLRLKQLQVLIFYQLKLIFVDCLLIQEFIIKKTYKQITH